MSPLQIKLAIYALIAIIITGAYFGWAYHQQQIGYEKAAKEVALRDADTARQSAEQGNDHDPNPELAACAVVDPADRGLPSGCPDGRL